MPNVPQGLTQPGEEENVNSPQGFEAAMAAKGIQREEGDADYVATDIASGLTYDEGGRAHGPDGKFAPTPTEPAFASEEKPDPLAAYIDSQHGGDADAALAALYQEATNQRSVIGRQGQELGEARATREELAEMRGRLDALTQMGGANQQPPPMTGDQADEYAADLIQRTGYRDAATQAANIAHSTGDDALYSRVIDQWNLEEPYQALTHVADFRAWQRDEAQRAETPPAQPDQWVEEQKSVHAIEVPLERLSKELGEERWAVVAPRMEGALNALPQGVSELVVSPDPDTAYSGLQIVAERAYLLGLAEDKQQAERQARKLSGAGVATGALRPPLLTSGGDISPDQVEAAKQRFKEAIMETETTDVRSGLTFGTAPGQATR